MWYYWAFQPCDILKQTFALTSTETQQKKPTWSRCYLSPQVKRCWELLSTQEHQRVHLKLSDTRKDTGTQKESWGQLGHPSIFQVSGSVWEQGQKMERMWCLSPTELRYSQRKTDRFNSCKLKKQIFEKGSYSSKPPFSMFIFEGLFLDIQYILYKIYYIFIFAVSKLYIWWRWRGRNYTLSQSYVDGRNPAPAGMYKTLQIMG